MSTKPGKPATCMEYEHDLENLDKGLRYNKNLEKAWNHFW